MKRCYRSHIHLALLHVSLILAASQVLSQGVSSSRGGVDWIFLIDTSASMVGADGSEDIFEEVKSTIKDFIDNARENIDTITVYTFDRDVEFRASTQINTRIVREQLKEIIDRLDAPGDRTHIGLGLHYVLKHAQDLIAQYAAGERTAAVVIFTDGKEDVRDIESPVRIPSNIEILPNHRPYFHIFYISLGSELDPQLVDFVRNPRLDERGYVEHSPNAERIQEIAERIRQIVIPPPPPPPPRPELHVILQPSELDFGQVRPGKVVRKEIKITAKFDSKVTVLLTDNESGIELIEPERSVEIPANTPVEVTIRLRIPKGIESRESRLSLLFQPETGSPDIIPFQAKADVRMNIKSVPLWRQIANWALILVVILALVLAILFVAKGETPTQIFQVLRERKHLEGELEILRPRPVNVEDGFIGLLDRQIPRSALSEFVPDGTGESDAELTTRFKKGLKHIYLTRTRGVVRVNEQEVAEVELYDGDLIEFGDVRMRFNRPGYERPMELSAEEIESLG